MMKNTENKTPFRLVTLLLLLAVVAFFAGYSLFSRPLSSGSNAPISQAKPAVQKSLLQITDAKMAVGLDDKLMPVQPTEVFPRDTRRVFCWFAWENAVPRTEVKAEWDYAVDNVHILTYAFRLPRQQGSGGISLIMPTGKVFPVGSYRVAIVEKDRVLKNLTFKVK
jgi:hypothetical protein